jgi:hypothetical protein
MPAALGSISSTKTKIAINLGYVNINNVFMELVFFPKQTSTNIEGRVTLCSIFAQFLNLSLVEDNGFFMLLIQSAVICSSG